MKTLASVAVILAAVAGILAVSVASALREQQQLFAEFSTTTRQQVHTSAEVLSTRLDALDQDTRTLVDLVERSRSDPDRDPATEHRIWASAFQALAVVVPQYRTITLFRPDGAVEVTAVDPTETAPTVDALLPHSRGLAVAVSKSRTKTLGKSAVRYGERSFLLYGSPVRGGGAIVVASDAAIFLGAGTWTPLPAARLYVTDPAGVVWSGCETAGGCRASGAEAIARFPAGRQVSAASVGLHVAEALGLHGAPVVQMSERVERPTGAWTITWLASSQAIVARERSLLFRLVLTAVAAALAVAGVGAVILRQQRNAVTLEGQLRYAQALANARETSESIVENAPLGLLGLSPTGAVVLANRFLTDRLGAVRVGAPLRDAFSGEGAQWVKELESLLNADGPDEIRILATRSRPFHVRVVPLRNHELGVRTLALVEDRSELRNLESHLVRAEKLITVGVLSAGIAHEIGSPLAVIRGRAEQVLRHAPTSGDDLRVIIKHIDNISSTIRQVLDFSRRQPIEQRAVALDSAVERTRALLQWKLESKRLRLRLDLEPGLPAIAADPDQLQQVLVNLLLNACDASATGGEVLLAAHRARDNMVRLEVVDHGCGIAPEHMNAVFDPFFTTKKRGEGTGLGLPIAAKIVENHSGEINLSSTVGEGTTVTVLWPAMAPGARTDA